MEGQRQVRKKDAEGKEGGVLVCFEKKISEKD